MKANSILMVTASASEAVKGFRMRSLTGDGACCVYLPSMEAEGRTPAELAGYMRRGQLRLANTSCRKL